MARWKGLVIAVILIPKMYCRTIFKEDMYKIKTEIYINSAFAAVKIIKIAQLQTSILGKVYRSVFFVALDICLLHSEHILFACIIKTLKMLQNREINVLVPKKWKKGENLCSHPKFSRGLYMYISEIYG